MKTATFSITEFLKSTEDRKARNIRAYAVTPRLAHVDDETRLNILYIMGRALEPGGLNSLAAELISENADKLFSQEYDCTNDRMDLEMLLPESEDTEPVHRPVPKPVSITSRQQAEYIQNDLKKLPEHLYQLAADGQSERWLRLLDNDWNSGYFPGLKSALTVHRQRRRDQAGSGIAPTTQQKEAFKALEYATRIGGINILNGDTRIGKSTSVKNWVDANLDRARYLTLESDTNMTEFYIELADALGCGYVEGRRTASEIKRLIREAIIGSGLTLVIDEAHNMLQTPKQAIKRIEWIRTGLVNKGVSVVLVTTPQFLRSLNDIASETGFNMDQIKGRVSRVFNLPEEPSDADLETYAKHLFPWIEGKLLKAFAATGKGSDTKFHAMKAIAEEARMLADMQGKPIDCCLRESLRSFLKYSEDLGTFFESPTPVRSTVQRPRTSDANPLHGRCNTDAEHFQNGRQISPSIPGASGNRNASPLVTA